MKAVVYTEYGSPDVLQITEVEKPTPGDDEVLIRVKAVSLNASDWELMCGKPLYSRIFGLLKPGINILGSDVAGVVEAVGKNVMRFKAGDEVFGDLLNTFGGFAEYVCAKKKVLTLKPEGMTFEQASALPQAACIALQGIRDEGKVQSGQHVLINGGGGGAGTFAIQLAKHFGAEVTGVDNAGKLDTMRSIGADHVIDYTKEDFTKNKKRYDLILDLAAYHPLFDYKRALTSQGTYLMVGGCMGLLLQLLIMGPLIKMTSGKRMGVLGLQTNKDLYEIIELVETGKISPVIDKQYTLSQTVEALKYHGEGKAKGKVIIVIKPADAT